MKDRPGRRRGKEYDPTKVSIPILYNSYSSPFIERKREEIKGGEGEGKT